MKKVKETKLWQKARRNKLLAFGVFALAFALVGTYFLFQSFAAGNTVYLTPVTNNVQSGSDLTLTLRLNSVDDVNVVDSTIRFDHTKLAFKSIDASGSAFPLDAFTETGEGSVNIVRGITSVFVSGDVEIAKVTFTAIDDNTSTTSLSVEGDAAAGTDAVGLSFEGASVTISALSTETSSGAYTLESSETSPIVGSQFSLKLSATSEANIKGGQVTVNLPEGLAYQGTLDTSESAFNPATTVTGTTAQKVNIVFVTQSKTLTGKQTVAAIPVVASTAGSKNITFSDAILSDINETDMDPLSTDPFTVNTLAATLPAPVVGRPGKSQISSSENITDYKQTFSINNFDNNSTYSVTLDDQALTLSNNTFSIPTSVKNGDLNLVVAATKESASGSATYTIRLRSPNINRTGCINLQDLFAVNDNYGTSNVEFDLNFDNSVGLIDLLTVTASWGGECI